MISERVFGGRLAAVREARRFVADAVGRLDDETAQAVVLMVSELATNAVEHARAREFSVRVDRSGGRLRVGVADRLPARPVVQHPAPDEPHGRGLYIVAELADDWGTEVGADGKTVWFELQLGAAVGPSGRGADGLAG